MEGHTEAEGVTIEEEPYDDAGIPNIPPKDSDIVLEQIYEDPSKAMVLYQEPQPVSIDTWPNLHRRVTEFVERHQEEEARIEARKAKVEQGPLAESVLPGWGTRRPVIYQDPSETSKKDPIQPTSQLLAPERKEEQPEIHSAIKGKRIKTTAGRITTRSKGIKIEEPKPAPVSKPKRKAAPKGKSAKPPPQKKQKQLSYTERILAKDFPPSPKKKKAPPKKKPKKEPEFEVYMASTDSGGYSIESGDYDLKSRYGKDSSNSESD